MDEPLQSLRSRRPVRQAVVAAIIPWNAPLLLFAQSGSNRGGQLSAQGVTL